jgi:hypothetical protein
VALSRSNGTTAATDYERYFYALHGQAKVGIMDLQVTGVLQDGTAAEPPGGGTDTDLSGWALLVRSWFTFGKLKLGGYFTYLSGDDNAADNDVDGFTFPNSSGGIDVPNIISGVRYSTITRAQTGATNNIFSNATAQGTGSCSGTSCRLNGMMIAELMMQYNVNPSLDLVGNISYVRSAEKITTAGFTSDKDFGWVFEGGAKWKIYKQLQLWMFASYVVAGDYGRTTGGNSPDDTWALYYEFRHSW